jgi:hypothetical protein
MKINLENQKEFIAIKVEGIDHWLWFEKKDVEINGQSFSGKRGWGKNRTITDIETSTDQITSVIYSDNIQ